MSGEAADAAVQHGGAVTRQQLGAVGRGRLARDLAAGRVRRALPSTFVAPGRVDENTRLRAALAWAGDGAALSHGTALALWGLPVPEDAVVDVLVDHRVRRSADVGDRVRLNRSRRPAVPVRRAGLPVVGLERAVVQAWTCLDDEDRRAAVLTALRERRTTAGRLRDEVLLHPRLAGRAQLLALLDLVAGGCESELEIWGHRRVFTGSAFQGWRWQVPVRLDGRTVRLDLYDEEARLAVELDGRRWHGGVADRERDVRRDAGLAEQGIQTVRLTSLRLRTDPDGCRRQVLRISAARRAGGP
ncbi:DUF559 domain-containing protein [Pseudokineococcus lusitanus]|uniref:Uncharacterized protein DUF559 n=1 Tax=Pseudokineococcus lusitanus TaxID=763993 RepID=A0A3N1HTT7_9ACTN|nr:DUF559 domain-containing protein [Pseudokineococcus lusitanus]ROP45869.1 uncharacterized protein DUF559 [Pseudokineococcus lusitanus]